MNTIRIENSVIGVGKNKFKVLVNREEYIMRDRFLYIDVDDNVPVELKVKHGRWYTSTVYKIEPKDNKSLQILINQRKLNRTFVFMLVAVMLIGVIGYFFKDKQFASYLPDILIFLPMFVIVFMRKKYVISEK